MLSHLADVRCDLMRFFPQLGIDPVAALDGPRFFELAERLHVFEGVVAFRARLLAAEQQQSRDLVLNRRGPASSEGVRNMPVAAFAASATGSSLLETKRVSGG